MPSAAAQALLPRPDASDGGALLAAYAAMTAMKAEIERLRAQDLEHAAARENWIKTLRRAASVQHDLLPAELPTLTGAKVRTFYRPANVVSGDFYDVFRLDDSKIAFVVADASGHDVSAGMMSAYVRGLFRQMAIQRNGRVAEANEVLAAVNAELFAARACECQFVSAVYAVYEQINRTVSIAGAGAPRPILVRDGVCRSPVGSGPILGVLPPSGTTFDSITLHLRAGDRLFIHTDGIEELQQQQPQDGQGWADWCDRLLRSSDDADPLETTEAFAPGHNPDDLTLLELHITGDYITLS